MNKFIAFLVSRKKNLGWALATLLSLWIVTWLVVPPLLKGQIEARGSDALGRKLSIGAIDFKPWTLELTVTDLAIATQDGSANQLALARIYVDAELQSLLRLAPVVDALTVRGLQVRLTHSGEGHYDIDDILQRLDKPSDDKPSAPVRFALHNLLLEDAKVDFTDHAGGATQQHTLRNLHLAIPFLSNLDSQREVTVSPRLAFELNGSTFDTAAQGTPFAQTRKGEAQIKITRFDLAPYLPYLPANLPVKPRSAVVDADLTLGYVQNPKAAVTLAGVVTLSQLALADAAGGELLAVDAIRTELADVRPLEQKVKLASIVITAPRLQVVRQGNGHLNVDVATKKEATRAASTGATGQNGTKFSAQPPAPVNAWTFQLDQFALHGGTVSWLDKHLQPQAKLALTDLELSAKGVQWPMAAPASLEGSVAIVGKGSATRLGFTAEGTDQQGSVQATVKDLSLALAAPYVAQFLEPGLRGMLDAQLGASWEGGPGDKLKATVKRLAVRDVALVAVPAADNAAARPANASGALSSDLPRFKLLEITDVRVEPAARSASIGKVLLAGASSGVRREADGQWMFQSWLKQKPEPSAGASAARVAPVVPAAPWKVSLGELRVQDASTVFADRTHKRPVRLEVSGLNLQVNGAQLDGKKPVPVTLSASIKSGQAEAGSLRYQGTLAWDPVQAQGAVELLDLPVHALAGYFADQLNIDLLRADASFKGQVRYVATAKGPEVTLKGDAALEDFRANSTTGIANSSAAGLGEELLSWKALNVPGIDLAIGPDTATRVEVREASLSDFYARIIVNPNGRINLQDLVKTQEAAPGAVVGAAAAPAPAASAVAQTSAGPVPVIKVGPVSLVNGKVLFSDRFIQPNYSADLSDLTGKLSRFSSVATDGVVQLADLELRGRAEGTASLDITGKLNPLAKPLALDIAGKVRDLELPPLSPYAVKYAGYGIERGKMSLDVRYAVQPDGQLTASNKLVLNQLTFGDKVEGAPNSLPVKLAVALLADRNGVIDLDLPISGSLNDPQFRLGPVIWKVITNLVTKALTAPFSLLANAFGGGDTSELSAVGYASGSAVLTDTARAGLDKVAKALADRPALRMTVVGTANLEAEREALKREKLAGLLLAEKRRVTATKGQDAATVTGFTAEEMPVLLRAVYRRADITKPRNLVGLTKDIAVPDMEALLLANITVNEDAIRDLALQRGVAVKDYLAGKKVSSERLFLGAIKTSGPAADAKPQAELNLAGQ